MNTFTGTKIPVELSVDFGKWLTTQLRQKHMTQRQLAMFSGVDHSTISRLARGGRIPSLETAQKIATGLREPLLGTVINAPTPMARVEQALRSDSLLSESQVRALMSQYLKVRNNNSAAIAAMRSSRPVTELVTTITRH
jgi:transcriptional regulator with XRE-family HTH domain